MIEQLINFINSGNYTNLISDLERSLNLKINKDTPSTTILNYDILKLKTAKINIDEIAKLIESDSNRIKKYAIAKLEKYNNVQEIQEYPKGEEPSESDKDIRLRTLPFYKNFLIIYLIEYFLLKTNPSELETYLKATRVPNAKKYDKELKNIYNKL